MYILYYCINIISKKMYIYIYIYICICILGEIQRQKSTNPVLYFRPPLPPCTFAKGGGIEATSQGCARAPMRQLQVPAQAALWKQVSGVAKLCLCKPCRVSWGVADASPATCNRWQHFHFFAGLRAREIPVLYSQAVSGPTAPTACQ